MQITPNDAGVTNNQLTNLDLKVVKLVNSLANKPLALEKLLVNQSQGVLLKLVANQQQKFELQLPLQSARFFEGFASQNSSSAPKSLSVRLTPQQQLAIVINNPPPSKPRDNSGNKSQLQARTLVFQQAKLLAQNFIKLGTPLTPIKVEQGSQQASRPNSPSSLSNTSVSPRSQEMANQSNQTNRIDDNKATNETRKLQLDTTNQKLNTNNREIRSGDKTLSVSDAAKHLLAQQYPKQLPVSSHLNKIAQLVKPLDTVRSEIPAISKLVKQINSLLSEVAKPIKITPSLIKNRIDNSGHSIEKHLIREITKLTTNDKNTSQIPNQKNLANDIKLLLTQNVKSTNQAQPRQIGKDLKIQLMQIRASLESIISSNVKSSIKTEAQSSQSSNASSSTSSSASSLPTAEKPPQNSQSIQSNPSANNKVIFRNQNIVNQPMQKLLLAQNMIIKQSTELLTEVKNLITQIETNQLTSLRNEAAQVQQFLVDLPFGKNSQVDSFELLFENSNENQNGNPIKRWKVVVRFDLEPLGPMFAQVELVNNRLSTHIFAESQQTAQLIDQNLHLLKQSLFSAGIENPEVSASQGNIPEKLLLDEGTKIDTHV